MSSLPIYLKPLKSFVMVRNIIGAVLILAGVGNFIGSAANSSSGRSGGGEGVAFGLFFIILGIVVIALKKSKPQTPQS